MKLDVEALKGANPIEVVVANYVELKQRGTEYLGKCPFHEDSTPSFYVSSTKAAYYCHGCGASGDVISFLQEIEGLNFKDACKKLNGGSDWKATAKPVRSIPARPERTTSKPPRDAGEPQMKIRALGNPVKTWLYADADGGTLGYVARYEVDGKKEIRCWTWGARGDEPAQWGCGHWTKPRPLYGLEPLSLYPDKPVLVVEGEKAVGAAQALLPQYVVVTWPGGANAWKHADWTPLRARRVDLWPDADEPGREAMRSLQGILEDPRGLDCHGKLIDTAGLPDGFDAADLESGTDVIDWLRARAAWYKEPNPAPQEAQAARPAGDPPSPSSSDGSLCQPGVAGPVENLTEPPQSPESDFPPEATLTTKPERKTQPRPSAAPPGDDSEPMPAPMSEDAVAHAFAGEISEDWRYVADWGHWLQWSGDGWRRDRKEEIDRLAVEVCRRARLWDEARSLTPAAQRQLGQRRFAGNVRDMARNDRRVAASSEIWDADPWLVGIPGGVYDVKAGRVILGERNQYITRRTAVAPKSGKPAMWLGHLERMMAGDSAMVEFLRLFAGYCATGDVREQCFLFLYGQGQTGKGTFLLTLQDLLGGYAAMSAASTFMSADKEKHSSEIARLAGCRLIVVDETDGTARWNEERIKRMTGGGKITAARKYHDEEDIIVTWKLAFAGNHKPALRGVGKEMERRIRLVKCNASIPDDAVDRNFRHRMIAEEGPQILNWILEGATAWADGALPLPEAVSDATRAYLTSEDIIGDWLEECCDQRGRCERSHAYRNYAKWAEARGDRAWSNRAWWSAMEDRGYVAKKSNGIFRIEELELKLPEADRDEGYSVD